MRSIGELDLIIYMHTYMYTYKNIHTNTHTCTHTHPYTPTTTTTIMTSTLSMGRRIKTLVSFPYYGFYDVLLWLWDISQAQLFLEPNVLEPIQYNWINQSFFMFPVFDSEIRQWQNCHKDDPSVLSASCVDVLFSELWEAIKGTERNSQ